jgi:hypothetical protein
MEYEVPEGEDEDEDKEENGDVKPEEDGATKE